MRRLTESLAVLMAVGAVGVGLAAPNRPAGPCDRSHLPREVLALIQHHYPGWDIVRLKDLRADDQRLWLRHHGKLCPGIAVGSFERAGYLSYALSLFKRRQTGYDQIFVVASKHGVHYGLRQLGSKGESAQVPYLSVIYALPPGKYSRPEGEMNVTTHLDSIGLEAIEAASVMYYWRDGRYHVVVTSE